MAKCECDMNIRIFISFFTFTFSVYDNHDNYFILIVTDFNTYLHVLFLIKKCFIGAI